MIAEKDIYNFLEEKVRQYNATSFVPSDPVQIPHRFTRKEDIEIAAFLTATISWGQRTTIINNAVRMVEMMPGGPYHFIMNAGNGDLERFIPFVHRTFNGYDCIYFMRALQNIYRNHGGLEEVFTSSYVDSGDIFQALVDFRILFLALDGSAGTKRHVPDVIRGSAAKRLNMFLRWMVRRDHQQVDFGIWSKIPMSALYIPLDIHSGATARKLGLLSRKQDDWKAVVELTGKLRQYDPSDPVKYDYALFGLGVFEKF